jgi:hypothetical protein
MFGSSRFWGRGVFDQCSSPKRQSLLRIAGKARGAVFLTACNAAAMALNGDEVSKISREIEDIAVAARAIYHRLLASHLKIAPTALALLEGVCRQSLRNKQQWPKQAAQRKTGRRRGRLFRHEN